MTGDPPGELDPRFSSPGASPSPWSDAVDVLASAKVYWLTTVRADGRPHVTPLAGVWFDGALYFCTGDDEQKAKNLETNTRIAVTTGTNAFEGLDVVLEAEAVRITDAALLERIAAAYLSKYGDMFVFTVKDGAFDNGQGGTALVFEVRTRKALGFGKGETFSQTRWRF